MGLGRLATIPIGSPVDIWLARWAGRGVVVVAMDPAAGAIGPDGYRTAWRGLARAPPHGTVRGRAPGPAAGV